MGKAIPTVEGWHSQHMVFSYGFPVLGIVLRRPKARKEAFRTELKSF